MFVQFILLFLGLGLVIWGADTLVEGASAIARRFGLSEFLIGLTIVGMGTSAPEMVVSFIGAAQGNADISIGNVVGSNIFNTLLILGITGLLISTPITRENRRRDIPEYIFIILLLGCLGMKASLFGVGVNGLTRWDGALLLLLFVLYMWQSFRSQDASASPDEEHSQPEIKPWLAVLMILGGLGGLIAGGNFFVDAATTIARDFGMSDKFIAITILAGGTSMPELATCVAAAIKKKGQLALGNIIGSNLFNILLILGGSALISPLSFGSITWVDLGILLASALSLLTACWTYRKNQLDWVDGLIMLALFAGYMSYLIIRL